MLPNSEEVCMFKENIFSKLLRKYVTKFWRRKISKRNIKRKYIANLYGEILDENIVLIFKGKYLKKLCFQFLGGYQKKICYQCLGGIIRRKYVPMLVWGLGWILKKIFYQFLGENI